MSAPAHPLLAALTASPGPHPPLAELRAYAAGNLSGPAAHSIEAHTLACTRCADLVEGLELTDPATTDRAVADLQQRLRQRVGELSERPDVVAPVRLRPRVWPRLAAAAAVVAGLGAGLWSWQHRPAAESKSAEVAMHSAPIPTPLPSAQAPVLRRAAALPPPPAAAPPPAAPPAVAAAPPTASRMARPTRPDLLAAASVRQPTLQNEQKEVDKSVARAEAEAQSLPPAPGGIALADSTARGGALVQGRVGSDTTSLAEVSYLRADQAVAQKSRAPKTKMAARTAPNPVSQAAEPPPAATARDEAAAVSASPAPARASAAEAAGAPRTRAALPPPPTLEPAPVGGYRTLRTYLRQQAEAFEPESTLGPLKGLVRVRFTVSAAGKPELDQAKILRSLRADYDAEVLRMLAEGPAWVPGVAGGRRAPLPVQVEVLF